MDRRRFTTLTTTALAGLACTRPMIAQQSTPVASSLLTLAVEMTDTALIVPEQIPAGLTELTVSNTSTSPATHWLMARLPPDKTAEEIDEFFAAPDDTEAIKFEDLGFVGVPDWPAPGGSVTGVVDLLPGVYLLLDLFGGRGMARTEAIGHPSYVGEPASDVSITLKDMTIDIPNSAFTSEPQRWRIDNLGSIPHDVAVVPISDDLTEEDLLRLLSLPDDATPTPGDPWIEYEPVAAIGVLAAGHTSWLHVELAAGRYVAICMLPFGTGYPHAMDGMFVIFHVA